MNESSLSSIEHLVAGGQGVLSKHVDLALLEAREMLAHSLRALALLCVCVLVGTVAWFTLIAAAVVWALPAATDVAQLLTFSFVNGLAAVALAMRARRQERPSGEADTRQRLFPLVDVSSERRESERLAS